MLKFPLTSPRSCVILKVSKFIGGMYPHRYRGFFISKREAGPINAKSPHCPRVRVPSDRHRQDLAIFLSKCIGGVPCLRNNPRSGESLSPNSSNHPLRSPQPGEIRSSWLPKCQSILILLWTCLRQRCAAHVTFAKKAVSRKSARAFTSLSITCGISLSHACARLRRPQRNVSSPNAASLPIRPQHSVLLSFLNRLAGSVDHRIVLPAFFILKGKIK